MIKKSIRVGIEFEQAIDSEVDNSINMISGYGNINITNYLDAYLRIDNISDENASQNYMIAGFSLSPEKGLKIMPNIRYTKSSDGDASTLYNLNFEFNIK